MPRTCFHETSNTIKPCKASCKFGMKNSVISFQLAMLRIQNHFNMRSVIVSWLEDLELPSKGLVFLNSEVLYCKWGTQSNEIKRLIWCENYSWQLVHLCKKEPHSYRDKFLYEGWSWMLGFPPRLIVNQDKKLVTFWGKIQECPEKICLYFPLMTNKNFVGIWTNTLLKH